MDVGKRLRRYKKYFLGYCRIWKKRVKYKNGTKYRKRLTDYARLYKTCEIRERQVLYESFYGRGMVDNPYAIFKELSSREEFSYLEHVWVLDDLAAGQSLIEKYKDHPNVRFILYNSKEYIRALAESKYLINNSTLPSYYIKKPGQVYINTWHRTPLKLMGYDLPDGAVQSANTVRNFLSADYLISANERLTEMYLKAYRLEGFFQGKIIEEGYPRNDLLTQTPRETVIDALQEYGICLEEGKKIILYAPTWKGNDFGDPKVDVEELILFKNELEMHIDMGSYQVLIKPHQIVYKHLSSREEYQGILIPSSIDTNELLSAVDILISDYSSIFLDFMVLKRPILFYIPDLDDYTSDRGLYMEVGGLPGPAVKSVTEIAACIRSISQVWDKYKDRYNEVYQDICKYEDGRASERLVDIVWKNDEQYNILRQTTEKKKMLIFRGGMRENGITHSFLNLLECLDYRVLDVTVIVYEDLDTQRVRQQLADIDPHVRVLCRVGTTVATVGEEARRELAEQHGLYGRLFKKIYPYQVAEREFLRCVGRDDGFDYIVNFDGYSPFFSMVMLAGKNAKKSIWMHNDIKAELDRTVNGVKTMRKCLHFNISTYPFYDRLVSCGRSVMEVNRENFATEETRHKFTYAKNTANEKRMRDNLARRDRTEVLGKGFVLQDMENCRPGLFKAQMLPLPPSGTTNFITMGRMSTEKNHLPLICAFARLHQEYPDTCLYILGDGPLWEAEESMIRGLGMEENICLTGNVINPFAFMSKCHCFVLPSLHEGQPIVLLEARTIGMPIILSDFSSVEDSLLPGGQMVVRPTEEGILDGLRAFMEGKVPSDYSFDIKQYNREAVDQFMEAVS